jgi:Uma2 family endonuclease
MATVAPRKRSRTAARPATPPRVIPGEQRIAIRGVSWEIYDRLSDAISEGQPVSLAYDGNDLEIMTIGRTHEDFKDLLGRLVNAITDDLHLPCRGAGQTTWKRPEIERGLEGDRTYYFRPETLRQDAQARRRGARDIAEYPNPDLAIEIDLSPPEVDRPGIYAALRVPEIWRFNGEVAEIAQLGRDGKYTPTASSRFLLIRPEEIVRWVVEEDTEDLAEWRARLREWILAELAPRVRPAGAARRRAPRRGPAPRKRPR